MRDSETQAHSQKPAAVIEEESLVESESTMDEIRREDEIATQIFKKAKPYGNVNCCSKIFFLWVSPLVTYAKKYKKIRIDQFGELREKDKVKAHIEDLSKVWDRYKDKEDNNKLFKAVFR
jgi:hypothetical protein